MNYPSFVRIYGIYPILTKENQRSQHVIVCCIIWIPPSSQSCTSLRATSHTRLKACDHCIRPLVKKAETVQVHFTLEGKGVTAERNDHGWKVHVDSYMAHYGSCFMVFRNLSLCSLIKDFGKSQNKCKWFNI